MDWSKFRHFFWFTLEKAFFFLSSIELAVCVILAIAFSAAVGTIYEAQYSASVAATMVYRSWWFSGILALFLANLFFVAMSRWPWKSQHIGFLLAHLGIITLIIGSILTRYIGIDGQIVLGIEEKTDVLEVDRKYLTVFASKMGSSYERVFHKPIEFYPGRKKQNWTLSISPLVSREKEESISFSLLSWYPKARRLLKVLPSKKGEPGIAALRFRIMGARANMEEWIFLNNSQESRIDLGPALVVFQKTKPSLKKAPKKRSLFIYFQEKDSYPHLATAKPSSKDLNFLGMANPNKVFPLGWMDLVFVLEEFYQKANPEPEYFPLEKATGAAIEVIEIEIEGKKIWVELAAVAQLSLGSYIFYVQFSREKIPLGFELTLKNFIVKFYEATNNPKSYESTVRVSNEEKDIIISMNEPLYYKGFTFYQSSYSVDQEGKPVFSVLSVNKDPGRWVKYLGSIIMIMGILLMFYFKPKYSGKNRYFHRRRTS